MRRSKRLLLMALAAPACGLVLTAATLNTALAATVQSETAGDLRSVPALESQAFDPAPGTLTSATGGDGFVTCAGLDAVASHASVHVSYAYTAPGPAPTSIPLPPALWAGSMLMGLIGVVSKFRKLV